MITLIYWQLSAGNVLTLNSKITVDPTIGASESPVILTLSYCKNIKASGTVRTSFVSSTAEIFQPVSNDSQPVGCHEDLKLPVLLPPASLVPPGKYKIKFHTTYYINPLKTVTQDLYTEEFTIK